MQYPTMPPRFLINNDGLPFKQSELQALRGELDALNESERTEYRNQNASAIARHDAPKFLIVSGPGTGKSHLFIERIKYWYHKNSSAKVLVTSFVRKLVVDLQSDINNDRKLTAEQKSNIIATTLHKFARSIVEKNRGTTEWPFKSHFRIIGQSWKEIIWGDALAFFPQTDRGVFTWEKFEEQLHNNSFETSKEWQQLKEMYFRLCQFYNAAGFADLILRATKALTDNPDLNENDYFIIDEYQDFNRAEEALIYQLVNNSKGLLVVGDDEQVLYEKLKSGKPTLIRNLYRDTNYAKGMLPFCGRSGYHITKSADHFIQQHREADCIEKIYLPLNPNVDEPKVQVIACAAASTAVDYIEKFVLDNKTAIDERKRQLEASEKKDAFLLILTPAKEVDFYGQAKEKIKSIAAEYRSETRLFSKDYYQLLSYRLLTENPHNNFTFRKVLHYENITFARIHELIDMAIQSSKDLCDLNEQEIVVATGKCNEIKALLDGDEPMPDKIERISQLITITDRAGLQSDMERKVINQEEVARLEHEEEEEAELDEIEVKRMGAVELMTIVGSKGLSADHVIIIGFDNVNMGRVTKNAFYVAMTRARKSLHILTALKSGGARQAHSFLDQLPDEHTEFYSYKKGDHSKNQLRGKQGFKDYLSNLNAVSGRRTTSEGN